MSLFSSSIHLLVLASYYNKFFYAGLSDIDSSAKTLVLVLRGRF